MIWLLIFTHILLHAQNPPQRIVVLSPALTEIVFALGAGERIVGVTENSDVPEAAKNIPRVGEYSRPSIEQIVKLQPDLVLISSEGTDTISEALTQAHIKWQVVHMKRLSDYPQALRNVAEALQIPMQASSLKKQWSQKWKKLSNYQSHHKVLIEVDHDPLMVAGGNTFLSDIISRCGSTNLLAKMKGYPRLSLEVLAKATPDVVLVILSNLSHSARLDIKSFWKQNASTTPPRLIFLNPDKVSRLGPRLPDAALSLCKTLKYL